MAARQRDPNPIGLSLDFERGRGFLWARDEPLSPRVTVLDLRMEIPDLRFPLDVSRGMAQFRDRRCMISDFDVSIAADVVTDWLFARSSVEIVGARCERGRLVVEWRERGTITSGFVVVGECDDDVVTLRVSENATRLAQAIAADLGETFDGELALRPLPTLLAELFARQGWKLPSVAQVELADVTIGPDGVRVVTKPRDARAPRRRPLATPRMRPVDRPKVERRDSPRRTPVPAFGEAALPDLDDFRRQLDDAQRRPTPLPRLVSDESSTLATILRRPRPATNPAPEPAAADMPPPAPPAPPGPTLADARKSGDVGDLADALERELQRDDLEEERRIELAHELGELLYYELEENARALPYLLEVRDGDPDGYGARAGVLNAIEAIYEEEGSVEGQIEILRTKLERAETVDLADTYRLLLAQLEWEERRDPERARRWLEPVLERDELHEGALRLLADIAIEREQWAEAAALLKDALSVAGDGLDSVELERRLARILLEHLGRAEEAAEHLRHVLAAAPGDAAAMSALRDCQASLGDWDGYARSLCSELGLLLGKIVEDDAWIDELDASAVPAPLRVTASQILADVATVWSQRLGRGARAIAVLELALELWPENVPATTSLIDHLRESGARGRLAELLESYARLLLDARERFRLLVEAAGLVGDERRRQELIAAATAAAGELGDEASPEVAAVRAELEALLAQ